MAFKIRNKLLIAFIAILLPFFILTIVNHYHQRIIYNATHEVHIVSEEIQKIAHLQLNLNKVIMSVNDYIITGDKKYIDNFKMELTNVENELKELKEIETEVSDKHIEIHLRIDKEMKIIRDVETAIRGIEELSNKIFEITNPLGNKDAARLMEELDYELAYPAIKKLDVYHEIEREDYREAIRISDIAWNRSWIIRIAGSIIVISISIFFALFYSKIFVLPIKQVHNGADAIAKGDFKVRLNIKTGDEIEQLSKAMNEMAKQLDTLYLSMGEKIEEGIKKFAAIAESANDAIIVLSSPDVIHFWNKKAEEMFGYKIDEVVGKSVHDFVVPQKFREKAKEGLNNFFKTGQGPVVGKVLEVSGLHRDGMEFPVELSVSAVRIGGEWQAIGIIRDITERKRLENGLRESEELYRGIFENTPNAMVIFDAETWRFENVNHTAIDLYGYTEEEFLSLTPMDVSAEEEKTKKAVHNGLAEKSTHVPIRYHKKKDGTVFPIEIFMGTFFSKGRKKSFAVIVDLTETKKAEEIIREKEQSYLALFENMMDGFAYCKMLFDEHDRPVDFVYLDVNNSFERLTGLKNVVGKQVTEVIPGIKELHPELFDIYGRVALTSKAERFEIYFKPLAMWLFISVYSLKKGYFIAVFDNITERKKAENELMQRIDELEQFRKVTIQRELRMEELKRKNKELEEELKIWKK